MRVYAWHSIYSRPFFCQNKCKLIIDSFFFFVGENIADGSVAKDPVKKLSAELVNLRSLLTAQSGIGLNGVILTGHREGKTLCSVDHEIAVVIASLSLKPFFYNNY